MPNSDCEYLVVGAGFAGAVMSERLASAGKQVFLIDKRLQIGGNAYDCYDEHGILIHPYGPHIFHTNLNHVVEYLSRFTAWSFYEHRVKAALNGQLYPIPINLDTLNLLYHLNLDEKSAQGYLEKVREPRDPIHTSEDVVLNAMGRDLYEKFYKNYSRKQWGLDPSQLDAGVTRRIPVRTNHDDRYFDSHFQALPQDGYAKMFEKMLDHQNITITTGTNLFDIKDQLKAKHIVYTGPIDAFFAYQYGKLPYRSLRFEHEHFPDLRKYQPVGTVNYPNEQAFTRITEFKHLTGQIHPGTSIVREYPTSEGEPYYPVPRSENFHLYQKYKELADRGADVSFVGRLAQYRYCDMDQTVDTALQAAAQILKEGKYHG